MVAHVSFDVVLKDLQQTVEKKCKKFRKLFQKIFQKFFQKFFKNQNLTHFSLLRNIRNFQAPDMGLQQNS